MTDTRYSLLARLAEPADMAAWSEFVQLYQQAIFRYSRSRGLQDADAWEVVQQVLLVVHRKIGQWRPSGQRGAFRSWLLKTAHCVCRHSLRDHFRDDRAAGGMSIDERMREVPMAAEPLEETRDWERWALCWAGGIAEREVEPATWQAFSLTAIEGVSAAEAAARLGIRVGSVYTARCRVLTRIRELVRELERGDQ
jgi:RNA polymerase sigma-70 factor (ECF subfamily)